MEIRIVEQTPEDHTLLRTHGRPYRAVPEALFVEDIEGRMRNILDYLTTEDGMDAEDVMEDIFLDDNAAKAIKAGTVAEEPGDKTYYRIHGDLEDELGL